MPKSEQEWSKYYFSPLSLAVVSTAGLITNPIISTVLILSAVVLLVLFIIELVTDLLLKNRPPLNYLVIMPTFTMAGMIIASKLIIYNKELSHWFWIVFFTIHLVIVFVYYVKYFNQKLIDEQFLPGHMVMFCGIFSAAISGSEYGQKGLNELIIIFGVIHLIRYYPKLIKYLASDRQLSTIPYRVIIVAPFPLLYLDLVDNQLLTSGLLSNLLMIVMLISLGYGLKLLARLYKQPIVASYAAVTFPLVISTSAIGTWIDYNTSAVIINSIYDIYQTIIIVLVIGIAMIVTTKIIKQ